MDQNIIIFKTIFIAKICSCLALNGLASVQLCIQTVHLSPLKMEIPFPQLPKWVSRSNCALRPSAVNLSGQYRSSDSQVALGQPTLTKMGENDRYRGPSELVQHFASREKSYRRQGAARHVIAKILLYRSPIPVGRRGSIFYLFK